MAAGGESEGAREGGATGVGLALTKGLAEAVLVVVAEALRDSVACRGENVDKGGEGVALSVTAATVPLKQAVAEEKAEGGGVRVGAAEAEGEAAPLAPGREGSGEVVDVAWVLGERAAVPDALALAAAGEGVGRSEEGAEGVPPPPAEALPSSVGDEEAAEETERVGAAEAVGDAAPLAPGREGKGEAEGVPWAALGERAAVPGALALAAAGEGVGR